MSLKMPDPGRRAQAFVRIWSGAGLKLTLHWKGKLDEVSELMNMALQVMVVEELGAI